MTVQAARLLHAPVVIPVHYEGWGHLTEGRDHLVHAFAEAGLRERLVVLEPGQATPL